MNRPRWSSALFSLWALAFLATAATPIHAAYVEALTNGGFERTSTDPSPVTSYKIYPPHSPYVEVAGSNALASTTGWRTTAPDEAIEIWHTGFNGVSTSAGTGPAQGGTYFAEINANVAATLYQDVTFNLAAQVDYFFMHRARQGSDTMRFTITDFGTDNTFGTADDVEIISFAVTNNTTNEAGESNGWRPYFGNNVFTSIPGRKYRVGLEAISTGSGNASVGNFIDSISFGAELETQPNFDPPTISDIPPQTTNEDTATGTINFTVGDNTTPVNSLTVTAFSEDTSIVQASGIVVGGSGANRTIVITPVANAYGDVTITVAVNDGSFSTVDTFVLTVNPVNDVPSFTKGSNVTVNEDSAAYSASNWIAAFSRGPSNESAQTVSYLVSNDANALFSVQPAISPTGTLTFTPALNANGVATVTVAIKDSGGTANGGVDTSATQTFTITINPVNDAPVATNDSYVTAEDTPLVVSAPGVISNDTDVDGNTLTASVVANPSNGTLTLNANGSFTYTPNANYNGPDSFTYRVNDGTTNSNVATVNINVTPVNDPPVANNDTYSATEDTPLVVAAPGVLANDTDPENDSRVINSYSQPANGTVTLNANGSFTYTPNANFNGPDTFTYIISDGSALSNAATVTINVAAVNDAPVAVNNSYNTNEDTPLTIAAPGVLGNDSDVDGNPLTAVLVGTTTNGSLTLNANGSFTYTPNANYNGTDSFTYRASDGTATSNLATVTINIAAVNDAPVAVNDTYNATEDTPLTIVAPGVLSNDTDVESNPLTASLVGNATNGSVSLNANGSFTYTPNANFNGVDTFTYRANDGTANSNLATVTINVAGVNDAPVATNDTYNATEDTLLTITLPGVLSNDSDVDGNPLTAVVVSTTTNGTLTLNANGSFTYMPNANYNGTDSFTYRASDGTATSNLATVTINIAAVNDAPVAVNDAYSTNEDTPLTIAAPGVLSNDTDAESNPISVLSYTLPTNGTVTVNGNGSFLYTPNANFNGVDTFTYRATDGTANSNVATVTITVVAVNDAPVAVNNSYNTNEDTPLTIAAPGVLGNDSDVEGSPLTAVLVGNASNGSVTLNADGSFTYTPDANYNGTDSFTYRASDGTATSNLATVTINIAAVNDTPVAVNDTYSATEDTPLVVVSPGVLGNDTDVDGNPLTVSLVAGPTHGTLTLNPNGSFTYTPTADYSGPDSFTYRANDGTANSNIATVTINVAGVNDAPVAVNDSYSTNEDTALTIAAPGVMGNDTDPDGNPLTATQIGNPAHGTLSFNPNGSFIYTPAANYNGPDSFTYRVNDGTANSNVATVNITVTAVNDAPVAVNDSYTTNEDTPLAIAGPGVLANDTDVEGSPLIVSLVAGPAHGTLTLNPNGSFTYTPTANYNGPDSFTYRVNDGTSDSNIATVNLTVTAVNDAPVAVNDSYTTNEDTALVVTAPGILANDTDVDANPLTAALVAGPTHGTLTLNPNGSFTYTPTANYNGPDSFTYRANDGTANSNVATVNITVNAVNDAPVAVGNSYTTNEDTALTVPAPGVIGNDSDVEGSPLTAVLVSTVSHGTLTLNPNGSFTYTPTADYNGPDSFTYKVNDGTADSNTVTVSITVNAVEDAPVAVNDTYNVAEDTVLTVPAPGVMTNDTDAEGNPLTATVVTGPTHGSLTLNPDGSFSYTPTGNYNGPDSFTYTVNDGTSDSNIATVSINVTSVNDVPVATGDTYSILGGTTLNVPAGGVLGNDTDVDGTPLTAVIVTSTLHGTLTLNPNGSFTYTPNSGYSGPDSFTYKANDGTADSNTVTVNITVISPNLPPQAVADTYTVETGLTLTVGPAGVMSNDSDPENAPISAALVSSVSHGTLTFNASGGFVYKPTAGYKGPDSFRYKVNDGVQDSNTVTVSITVTPVNRPPVVKASSTIETVTGFPVNFPVTTTDPDSDTVTLTFGTPLHGTVTGTGPYIYTPSPGYIGTDTFTVLGDDGHGHAVIRTIKVNVNAVPGLVGNYSLHLRDAAGEIQGHLVMTTTKYGRVTGVATIGGIRYIVRGYFGGFQVVMYPRASGGLGEVAMDLSMDRTNPAAPELIVALTDTNGTYTGRTVRSPYSTTNQAPQAGSYTIIVSRDARVIARSGAVLGTPSQNAPTVAAVLTAKVRTNGAVTINGYSSHGYRLTCSTYIMPGSLVPFYAGRRAPGASILYSTFAFPDDPAYATVDPDEPAIHGVLRWIGGTDKRVTTPVDSEYAVLGARYVKPATGAGLLGSPRLTLRLDMPTYPTASAPSILEETRPFTSNLLAHTGGNIATIRVTMSSGAFITRVMGTVVRPVYGVVIQGEELNIGMGTVLDLNTLGTCELIPAP